MNSPVSKILLVLIVIVAVVGGIFAWQFFVPEKDATKTPQAVQDETADWKTYRNEGYGFEVKYPQDWFVQEDTFMKEIYFGEKGEVTGANGEKIPVEKIGFSVGFYSDVSKLWGNEESRSLEDWISKTFLPLQETELIQSLTFGVDNYEGFLVKKYKEIGVVRIYPTVYAQMSTKVYEIQGEVPALPTELLPTKYNYDKIFNQMLSTFRFIEYETAGPPVSCEYKKGEYEFRVYDSEGRVTGLVRGVVKQEISRSVYANGDVTIFFPQDYYEYELFALKEGNYQLERSSIQEGEKITFRAINIPISPGQTHRYRINWKNLAELKNGAELFIDKNEDGSFEKTIPINGTELTCQDFIAQIEK